MVCDHCGRSIDFIVFSVKRTQRMRILWFTILMFLLTLSVVGLVFIFDVFVNPGRGYIEALPVWTQATVAISGILSMWAAGYSLFFWSDEFGIRSRFRWRHTGQVVSTDKQRGNFIGKCVGTWDSKPQDKAPT